jgi:hypothetical protein
MDHAENRAFFKKQNLITIFFERKLYNLFIKNMRIKIIFIQKLIKMITLQNLRICRKKACFKFM